MSTLEVQRTAELGLRREDIHPDLPIAGKPVVAPSSTADRMGTLATTPPSTRRRGPIFTSGKATEIAALA